ncbi:MAG: glutathione S-transferase family protein [Gemmobacter sp.]|nr:glutathione S-transferase family protein [Gemmobacter sp.]
MLSLYGAYRSRASRPLWLLAEIGLPFRHVPVIQSYRLPDASAPDAPFNTASAAFLAINPQGLIPCMEDDGLVLTESLAMCLYIAKKYGDSLGPRDVAEDAQMTMWALVGATAVEGPALEIQMVHGRKEAETPAGAASITANLEKLARPLRRIELHLTGRDWLVGERFTVADVMLAECVRYAQGHPGALEPYPHLFAWLERCQSRPAFQVMWDTRNAEPM